MAETLKPCPYCGGEARFETYGGTACAVVCQSCHCGTPTMSLTDGTAAVNRWNLRAERTATIEVSHGDHGPEPRFVGDVWTMHHACSACGGGGGRGRPLLQALRGEAREEGGLMSAVEYTRCDAADCGRVTPDEPESYMHEAGWASVTVWGGDEYDLCPECARKALAAVGIGGES